MNRRSLLIALVGATGAALAAAQNRTASNPPDKLALADVNVKELLLLMDADHDGKISKQEWMSFMEAEFNRLDKDGNGELDVNELRQAGVTVKKSKS